MIASKLILWHAYQHGVAFDLSEHRNHGALAGNAHLVNGPPYGDAIRFDKGDDAVWVQPSDTLTELGAVRVQVRFNWEPQAVGPHRHNLVEGQLSFALFVNPDGSIQGTILNALGSWLGAKSGAGVVSPNTWHVAEFVHDGVSHCTLYVDGHVVDEGFTSPGPVRGVGPHGIAIGHWPEPGSQYTLRGLVDRVKVWTFDPERTGQHLIDDCCIDREAIDAATPGLRSTGLSSAALGDVVHQFLDIGRQAASVIAGGSAADRDAANDLARRALVGFATDDHTAIAGAILDAAGVLAAKAPAGSVQSLYDQLAVAMAPLPGATDLIEGRIDRRQIDALLAGWCLDHKLPPHRPDKPRHPRPATDDSLDPDTDGPDRHGKGGDGHDTDVVVADPGDPVPHEQVPPPDPATPPPDPEDAA
jgi:hypothetical protein